MVPSMKYQKLGTNLNLPKEKEALAPTNQRRKKLTKERCVEEKDVRPFFWWMFEREGCEEE